MRRIRRLLAVSVLACATASHAASDAEVRQWLDELLGSALVLQELKAGHCSDFMRDDRVDVEAWYSWAAALGSSALRASAERSKAEVIMQARASVGRWVADEFRKMPESRPLQTSCRIYTGIFRTIRDAAESELEDIEYRRSGRVTPRGERR